jgi:hypothetical protein
MAENECDSFSIPYSGYSASEAKLEPRTAGI